MSGFAAQPLTDLQADQLLGELRSLLSVQLTSPRHVAPGQLVTASLIPTSPLIDASALLNGFLNLAFTTKNVLFHDTSVADVPEAGTLSGDSVLGGAPNLVERALPFPPPSNLSLGAPLSPNTTPPGLLGQLFGSFAQPKLDVRVGVTWQLRRPNGSVLADGTDFIATTGITSPTVALAIPPLFREMRLDSVTQPHAGAEVLCLFAHVVLVLGSRTLTFDLPGIPLVILPLLVPAFVAMFTQPAFDVTHDSGVLILVPPHCAATSAAELVKQLQTIENALDRVRSLAGIAGWLLGIGAVLSSIPEQPRIRFVVARAHQANGIGFLSDIKLGKRPWYDFLSDDPSANDAISSIAVIGVPGVATRVIPRVRVEFYNSPSYQSAPEGHYVIELDATGYAVVRSLDTPTVQAPVTLPPGRVVDFHQDPQHSLWDDRLSSVRFADAYLAAIDADIRQPPGIPVPRCLPIITGGDDGTLDPGRSP